MRASFPLASPSPPASAPAAITLVPFAEGPRWDALVARAEGATFCHLAAWREVMSDALGHECLYRVALDPDGEWLGVLPLVRVRSRLFGHYLVSLPFLNAGGPIGTAEARARLAAAALDDARTSGADLLELRAREPVPGPLAVAHRKVRAVLELPARAEHLWETFPAKLRSQIRRPQKEGMEARFGPDEREPFYEVFARHMRELGTPVLPAAFFERVARLLAPQVLFGAVYQRGRPVAAGCGFAWGEEFEITWASALRSSQRLAPNMLLYWGFLEALIARGIRRFDFGRSTPGSGPHRFKQQWGGADVALPWAQWSPRGVSATPTPDGPVYRVATAVWRRLPLAVTNRLGPVLARRIP